MLLSAFIAPVVCAVNSFHYENYVYECRIIDKPNIGQFRDPVEKKVLIIAKNRQEARKQLEERKIYGVVSIYAKYGFNGSI